MENEKISLSKEIKKYVEKKIDYCKKQKCAEDFSVNRSILNVIEFYLYENVNGILGKDDLMLDEIIIKSEDKTFFIDTIFDKHLRVIVDIDGNSLVIGGESLNRSSYTTDSFNITVLDGKVSNECTLDGETLNYTVNTHVGEYVLNKCNEANEECSVTAKPFGSIVNDKYLYDIAKASNGEERSNSFLKSIVDLIKGNGIMSIPMEELKGWYEVDTMKILFGKLKQKLGIKKTKSKGLKAV